MARRPFSIVSGLSTEAAQIVEAAQRDVEARLGRFESSLESETRAHLSLVSLVGGQDVESKRREAGFNEGTR